MFWQENLFNDKMVNQSMQSSNILLLQISIILATTTVSPLNVAMVQQQPFLDNHPFAGGQGTEGEPYIIKNMTHLNNIRNFRDSYFRLESDINFAPNEYADAQKGWEPILNFTGGLDGKGYSLRNLFINRSKENNIGLFSNLISPGKIKNLQLVGCNVFGGNNTGCLVGFNSNSYPQENRTLNYLSGGKITNVFVSGNITGQRFVGGVSGGSAGHMEKIYAKTNVTGESFIGGIAGHVSTGLIIDSFADTNVNGICFVGGIAGILYAGQILRSGSKGNVLGTNFTGGISGGTSYTIELVKSIILEYKLILATSEYYGVIKFPSGEGSIAYTIIAYIQDSYSNAVVQGESFVGGLSGSVGDDATSNKYPGNVNSSYSTGKVTGSDESTTGGLIGKLSDAGIVSNSYYDIETSRQIASNTKGVPKSTSQLKAGLLTYPKWDSANVWVVNRGFYPVLRLAGPIHIFNTGNLNFTKGEIGSALSWFVIGDYYGNYSIQLNDTIVKSTWENGMILEYNLTTLLMGIHDVRISAFDRKNTTSSILELRVNITSDDQSPEINTQLQNFNVEVGEEFTLFWNISDTTISGNYTLYRDGIEIQSCGGNWPSNHRQNSFFIVRCTLSLTETGTYNFTLNVTDINGNSNSNSIIVLVITTGPEFVDYFLFGVILSLGGVGLIIAYALPSYPKKLIFWEKVKGLEETVKTNLELFYKINISKLFLGLSLAGNSFQFILVFFPRFLIPQTWVALLVLSLIAICLIVFTLGYRLGIWGLTLTKKAGTKKSGVKEASKEDTLMEKIDE